ncbi:MAG: MEDS domain-containing protein [Haloferacaceae archaeon]
MDTRIGSSNDLGGLDGELGLDALRESAEFRGPVEPLDDHDHANGHFALIYETAAERLAATIPFVRQGFERDEHVLYVVESRTKREEFVEALRERGVDVDGALESGALTFATVGETYLRSEPFDPDEMISFYADTLDDVFDEYEGFRVVAGTDWIDDVPLEAFLEYEGRVNALFDEHDAMAMCQYDRTRISADVIADVVRSHPHLIYDDNVCHNFYYTPPDELLGDESADHEADRMLQTLQDRTEARTELAEHERFLRKLNGVMSSPDRSFEEKLQALFDLGCERFDMELGGLNRVDPDEDWFQVEYLSGEHDYFEPGLEVPLSETYCRAPAEVMDTASVSDPSGKGFDGVAIYEEYGARAYIGTHISVSGGTDRTFAFLTSESREAPFSEEDRAYIEMMGQWVKYELERERREAALQRSKEQFERIFRNSHDPIFINDPYADELLKINPAGCEMLGYTEEEVLARGPSDFHPDEMERFRAFVDHVYDEGSGWTDELTCLHADGHRIPTEISASAIEYEGRECMLAMVRDISERKERQRELERAERQFEAVFNNPVSFVGLLDPDGTVRRVNENALEFAGLEESDVRGEKFWEMPWFAHSAEVRENLREWVARAAAGEYVRAELPHQSRDGETAIMDAILEPVVDGGEVVGIVPSGHDITELRERERFQRRLYETVADPDRSFEGKLRAVLDLWCDRIDMGLGGLAAVDPATDRFEVEVTNGTHDDLGPGDEYPLSETYCRETVAARDTVAITDPAGFEDSLCHEQFGVGSYLGAYIELDGADDRTFWFVSSEPREEGFSEFERTFHHLIGQWIQYELQHQHDTDTLTALNDLNGIARDINRELVQQPTREEIEAVVCEHLAASDSYDLAWIGALDDPAGEIVPSTTANIDGHLDGVTIPVDEAGCPAGTAVRTGETQIATDIGDAPCDVWRELARERGLSSSVSVPIVYEHRTYGVLNVFTSRKGAFDDEERAVVTQLGEIVGLTIAAIEREEELEHERERLELINRLLRHNLLNGLNLVGARLEMLDGRVDFEVRDHLETARNRTDEMVDLIETLRALTGGLIDDEYELEPIDLGRVLGDELDRTRETYDDAVFEVRADLDSVPAVLADDLLEVVFENLLVNAVRHNDKTVPRVAVDVETGEKSVTVHVRDNGPGVPAQMQDLIFEEGQKGFESPGTGFGLHLVREIVNVYGGDITVGDNDPEGAVFSITLPRPGVGN